MKSLRELRAEGLSIRQIAACVDMPRSTVADRLRGMEIMRRCELCGSAFWAAYAHRRFCCTQHQMKAFQLRRQGW